MKITATGVLDGIKETIIFEDGKFKELNLYLEMLLEDPKPLGGTYWPEKFDPLNVYYTLRDRYFDKLIDIVVDGDLGKIPTEEGEDLIY